MERPGWRRSSWLIASTLVPALASAGFDAPIRIADAPGAGRPRVSQVVLDEGGRLYAIGSDLCPSPPVLLSVSDDDGRSWAQVAELSDLQFPQVVASGSGRLDIFGGRLDSVTVHRRSLDGGVTWSDPSVISHDWLYWDLSLAVSEPGRIAVGGWAYSPPGGYTLQVMLSDDGGRSWLPRSFLGTSSRSPGLSAAIAWVGPESLLACWTDSTLISCARSDDSGVSFDRPTTATRAPRDPDSPLRIELARRGPMDMILAVTGTRDVWAVRSRDGGTSWSGAAVLLETAGPWVTPSLSTHPTGEVWLASRNELQGYQPQEPLLGLWSTGDGDTWRETPLPGVLGACFDPGIEGPFVVAPAWRQPVVLARGMAWRTSTTTGWDAPAAVRSEPVAAQDLQLVRTTSGRWVALWLGGRLDARSLQTSHSMDLRVWSAPVSINDARLTLRGSMVSAPTSIAAPAMPSVHALATADGGVIVTWLGGADDGCGEVRVTRSEDGESFGPSAWVGSATGPIATVAEGGDGALVAVWEDHDILFARSTDGGLTWSSPELLTARSTDPSGQHTLALSPVVTSARGTLLVSVARQLTDDIVSLFDLRAYRGDGISWEETSVAVDDRVDRLFLVGAGDQLTVVKTCVVDPDLDHLCGGSAMYRSSDDGRSWRPAAGLSLSPVALAGAADGAIYSADASGEVSGIDRDGGWLGFGRPSASLPWSSALLADPGEITMLFAEPTAEGVFVARAGCPDLIHLDPADTAACAGGAASFSIVSAPTPGLTYQWLKDGVAIPGATSASLVVSPVTEADAGVYVCEATGTCVDRSRPARLTVGLPAAIGNTLRAVSNGGWVRLTWQEASGATFYDVEERVAGGDWSPPRAWATSGVPTAADVLVTEAPLVALRVVSANECGSAGP